MFNRHVHFINFVMLKNLQNTILVNVIQLRLTIHLLHQNNITTGGQYPGFAYINTSDISCQTSKPNKNLTILRVTYKIKTTSS